MKLNLDRLKHWLHAPPFYEGQFQKDRKSLSHYLEEGRNFLNQLEQTDETASSEKRLQSNIFEAVSFARSLFIEAHADEIYSSLTENFSLNFRLTELMSAAANSFPELLHSQKEMDQENSRSQNKKVGLELSQGIFLQGILNSPKAGKHLCDSMLTPTERSLNLLPEFISANSLNLGTVFISCENEVAHLTINNQKSLNAEDNQLIQDLEVAVDLVLLDHRIKVVVLRGGVMTHARYSGRRVFSAGINLSDLQAGRISFVDFFMSRELGYISKIKHGLIISLASGIKSLHSLQKTWIAAIDSFAIGGGMQLLLVFDKIIAAQDAYFSLPAAQEGIIPGAANFRLPQFCGSRLSRQIILSGKKIFMTDPEAHYFCDLVVPTEKMDETIKTVAREMSNAAVTENRRMLCLGDESREDFQKYMAEFAIVQSRRIYAADVLQKIDPWGKS